jgi:hypothetical protein
VSRKVLLILRLLEESPTALLVTDDTTRNGKPITHWLPKVQTNWGNFEAKRFNRLIEIEVSEWLAKERGLLP